VQHKKLDTDSFVLI